MAFHVLGLDEFAGLEDSGLEVAVDFIDTLLEVVLLVFGHFGTGYADGLVLARLDNDHLNPFGLGGFRVVGDDHIDTDGADGRGGRHDDLISCGGNPIGGACHLGIRVGHRRLGDIADLVSEFLNARDRTARG